MTNNTPCVDLINKMTGKLTNLEIIIPLFLIHNFFFYDGHMWIVATELAAQYDGKVPDSTVSSKVREKERERDVYR